MMIHCRTKGLVALLLATTATPAFAQDATATPQQADEGVAATDQTYGDIIVTARRTAENIQSTPVSITAFGTESLRQAQVRDTQDLLFKTPGVFLAGSGGRENSNFSVRGQSKALAGNSAPGVISYFADVPAPTLGSSIPTYDLASVQVLKGPQGTLFGRNTTGGAILYYPTMPTYDLEGYVQATYGSYNAVIGEAAINLPIVDQKVALRISGQYQKRDGWTKNIGVGKDADDLNSRAIRGTLLLEPFEGLKNTTIVDYYRNRSTGGGSVLVDVFSGPNALTATGTLAAAQAQLAAQRARGIRVIDSDVDAFERAERFGVTNRTEVTLSDAFQLVNLFGYRRTKVDYFSSVDGLPTLISDGTGAIPRGLPVMVVGGRQTSDVEQITNELQFKGTVADGKLDWLVGGFYLKSKPKGPTGTYIPIFILPGFTNAPFNYGFFTETSKAVFGNITYKLDGIADGLRFNAGFRHTWDEISACVGGGTSPNPVLSPADCNNAVPAIVNSSVNRTKSKAPTWTIGLDWQASDELFVYAVTRRGYRAGGINSPTLAGRLLPFQSFSPEKVTDLEFGVRSDFKVGNAEVRLNASPFVGWYSNVQVPVSGLNTQATCSTTAPGGTDAPRSPDGDCNAANDPSGGTLLVNAGSTRVSGIDLSARIAPTATLAFEFGATLLDLKTRSLTVPTDLQPYLRVLEVPFNLVARQTLTAGLRWTLPVPESIGKTVFSTDFYHSSSVQSSDAVLPPYVLVNARLDIGNIAGTGVDASFFVRNLFDREYLASSNVGSNLLGVQSGFYGAPRTVGGELRYRFGN
ncbi:iron complex outermembrane receptor protein [Sphingobium fontiphilum]|uniref:Iron complex outermembrane receptor protein n=1 Tax=Sphingobium fontiphilum TaxID=944425 RepID=A0A7W6GPD8_9SPHN|nr:TonB-dependent receptor plug domain-containing protein [Sphingobium fontiphilum]MBB3982730.1 iron complex outermembrane receptor protein [Sphingobium fontiphilum]